MCKSQSSWFRCRLLTKINLITNEDHLLTVHLIDWGMERQIQLSDLREMPQSFVFFMLHLFQIDSFLFQFDSSTDLLCSMSFNWCEQWGIS